MARIFLERREAGDDWHDVLEWLDADRAASPGAAEHSPPMDVFETASAIEVRADLPGTMSDAIRVVFARGLLIVAGTKACRCEHREVAFHLAERSFGRFARVIKLAGAFDAGAATARLDSGELHIVLPRIEDRRGREIPIPVQTS